MDNSILLGQLRITYEALISDESLSHQLPKMDAADAIQMVLTELEYAKKRRKEKNNLLMRVLRKNFKQNG